MPWSSLDQVILLVWSKHCCLLLSTCGTAGDLISFVRFSVALSSSSFSVPVSWPLADSQLSPLCRIFCVSLSASILNWECVSRSDDVWGDSVTKGCGKLQFTMMINALLLEWVRPDALFSRDGEGSQPAAQNHEALILSRMFAPCIKSLNPGCKKCTDVHLGSSENAQERDNSHVKDLTWFLTLCIS